ncbi:MetQ/NlpA family ABC transporter substrate-binding protein [Clostridium aestuarii]|uniref:MetQ/NlpA family ABC transporter substrate-binding protein n=1 Tax=Clostridium aestuarii TaxID=338193 RepID=A0ABT4D0W4_9CLOT|nr:MetQ/NlpA family ABC transporter substrate-binding protein [Clostridium aestuarii]MCY6484737.1 MetQ/NlpA family ABC transporter substrate-binding protein [Clostridium aestuarii]
MKKKSTFLILIIFILNISLIGCSNNKTSQTPKEKETLNLGLLPSADAIPFIIAKHNGYFENEGVTVNLHHFKSAIDRDSAFQTGNIDGAMADMLSVIFSNDNGFNVKMTSKTNGSFKLIAGKNSNINDLEQIKGKTIGISKNTVIEYITDKIMQNANIADNEYEKVAVPKMPTRLEMLHNNKLATATLPEPLASDAINKGCKVLSSSNDIGIYPGIMVFSQKAIDTKQEEIKALYRAYNKAIDYLQKESKEKYIDVVIKEGGFPESIRTSSNLPDYTKAVMPSEKDFTEVLNWLKSKKLTSNDFKFTDLSDSSLIE